MIGIDVVDLKDPTLKPRDRSHLRFISHRNENHNKFPEKISDSQVYWIYWAAKEAVYKFHRLEDTFDPKLIEIQIQSVTFGPEVEITFKSDHAVGKVWIDDAKAIAIAYGLKSQPPIWELFDISNSKSSESAVLRELSVQYLSSNHELSVNFLDSKIPTLMDEKSKKTYAASLSHHKRYGAFAMIIN